MTTSSPFETSDSTSQSLLDRVKAQDPEAWRRLTSLYTPIVYSWCRQNGLQAEDAGDIVQEVFRGDHRNIVTFRRDRPGDAFRGWMWSITRNKIRDHFRDEAGRPVAASGSEVQQRLQEIPDAEPPSELTAGPTQGTNSLFDRGLELVKAEFEEKTWRAYWRSAVDGADTADIADELGIRPSTVRTAKSRVLRRLREELRDLLD